MAATLSQKICAEYPSLRRLLKKKPRLQSVLHRLEKAQFAGVYQKYLLGASPQAVVNFLQACSRLDWAHLQKHRQALRCQLEQTPIGLGEALPVAMVESQRQDVRRPEYSDRGEQALRRGLFAAVAFAGGSGTRFFSQLDQLEKALTMPNLALQKNSFSPECPKGCFPISPVAGLTFYQLVLAEALETGIRYGKLPWVLFLTSQATDKATRSYLATCSNWGFPRGGWLTFRQARVPRLDDDGDLIVEDEQGHLSLTGDGHGGVYRALIHTRRQGKALLDRLREDGVRHLVMHNIDNAAARPFFEARLGFHLVEKALFTLSVVRKTEPREKVGLVIRLARSGRIEVVEYNQLDESLALARGDDGRLLFAAGNTNTSLVALEAIREDIEPTLYTGKQVVSRMGPVMASSFEMLNQHLTRRLDPERVKVFEVEREEFFLPTKNVVGPDSVETTIESLAEMGRRKLRENGAEVHPQALVDLHPCCRRDEVLAALGVGQGWRIGPGAMLYLCLVPENEPVFTGPLTLEPGSLLALESTRPYGRLTLGPRRNLIRQPPSTGSVRFGKNIVIKSGTRVHITIDPAASLLVPDGTVFSRDVFLQVRAGKKVCM